LIEITWQLQDRLEFQEQVSTLHYFEEHVLRFFRPYLARSFSASSGTSCYQAFCMSRTRPRIALRDSTWFVFSISPVWSLQCQIGPICRIQLSPLLDLPMAASSSQIMAEVCLSFPLHLNQNSQHRTTMSHCSAHVEIGFRAHTSSSRGYSQCLFIAGGRCMEDGTTPAHLL
jgi:hypothetical protein